MLNYHSSKPVSQSAKKIRAQASLGRSAQNKVAATSLKRRPASKPRRKDWDVVLGTRSRKQRGVVRALWDRAQLGAAISAAFNSSAGCTARVRFLQKSADAMRAQLQRSPSWRKHKAQLSNVCVHLDEHLIALLDGDGSRFALKADAAMYHRLGSKFYATDEFLTKFVSILLHPDNTSVRGILRALSNSVASPLSMLPAPQGTVVLGVIEAIVAHPIVTSAMWKCRAAAPKTVLAIDAQFKTMMDVLYQIPFGQERPAAFPVQDHEAHCVHTVRGADTLLLATVRATENFNDQLASLMEAVGKSVVKGSDAQGTPRDFTQDVRMIYSDAPGTLDAPALYNAFGRLECLAMDPIHVALKIEQATGGRKNACSVDLRRCMLKFAMGGKDRQEKNIGEISGLQAIIPPLLE